MNNAKNVFFCFLCCVVLRTMTSGNLELLVSQNGFLFVEKCCQMMGQTGGFGLVSGFVFFMLDRGVGRFEGSDEQNMFLVYISFFLSFCAVLTMLDFIWILWFQRGDILRVRAVEKGMQSQLIDVVQYWKMSWITSMGSWTRSQSFLSSGDRKSGINRPEMSACRQ